MSYIAQRREEEKERRRVEIIDAAEQLYASKGWDEVTMDQVARAARLSRALVYVYFKDKEDLLFAVVERAMNLLADRFAAAGQRHGKGLDRIEAMGRAYVAFSQEFPHLFDAASRFQSHQATADGPSRESACLAAGVRVHETLVAAINAGFADGSIRRDVGDPDAVCVALWGFSHGIIQLAATKANEIALRGLSTAALMQQAFALLRYSLAAPGHA
jgi:AcrR family transcriptional regulator